LIVLSWPQGPLLSPPCTFVCGLRSPTFPPRTSFFCPLVHPLVSLFSPPFRFLSSSNEGVPFLFPCGFFCFLFFRAESTLLAQSSRCFCAPAPLALVRSTGGGALFLWFFNRLSGQPPSHRRWPGGCCVRVPEAGDPISVFPFRSLQPFVRQVSHPLLGFLPRKYWFCLLLFLALRFNPIF